MNRPHPLRKRIEALQNKRMEALIAAMSNEELLASLAQLEAQRDAALGGREKAKR